MGREPPFWRVLPAPVLRLSFRLCLVAGSRTLAVAARASVTPRELLGIQRAAFSHFAEGSTVAHARHRPAGRFWAVSSASTPWSCLGGAVHLCSALAGFRPRVWHSPSGKAPVLVSQGWSVAPSRQTWGEEQGKEKKGFTQGKSRDRH